MRVFAARPIDYRAAAIVTASCILLGWMAQRQLLDGGTHAVVIAAVLALLPVLALVTWRRPLLFPFCAYAALVPFDNLLSTGVGDTVTKLLAIAAAGILLLHLALKHNAVAPPRAVFAWLAVIIWMAATIFWALDQGAAIDQFVRYAQLFGLLAIISIYPATLLDVRAVVYATIAGGCAASIYGAYLFINGVGNVGNRLVVTAGDSKIDPNHFGASLLLPLALAIILTLRAKFGWQKLVAIVPLAILLTGLYSSESRGAFTAVAVMMLLFIIISRYRVQAIAVSALAMLAIPATFIARLQIAGDSGGNGRFDIWRSGLAAFKEHWLVGAGIGNFPTAYDNVFLKVTHNNYFSWHIQAHDLLMQTSVELGVVGVVLVFGAWFVQFRDARSLQSVEGLEDMSIALQGAIVALLVSASFLDIMWSKYTWLAFILVALTRSVVVAQQRTLAAQRQPSLSIGGKLCDV